MNTDTTFTNQGEANKQELARDDSQCHNNSMSSSPQLIAVAGPNGAGKSTLAPHLLRDAMGVREFVDTETWELLVKGNHDDR